ncbi:MAG: hypothetical protein GYA24_18305 [Candidatus Lokiarchaeota archaeon]|nr:hypothetical protein [Candidatus Lokiarchaeota archaeon]
MRMIKEKIGVVAGSMPVIAALALISLPFISYLAWAIDQVMLDPAIPRAAAGPSTILDFIGTNAGYMVLGIVLSFMAFPVLAGCIKHLHVEMQDHALLLEELHACDAARGVVCEDDRLASRRELVFRINGIHASQARIGMGIGRCGDLNCFACGKIISARENMQFHASCTGCYYMAKGAAAYAKGACLASVAVLLAVVSMMTGIHWAWWGVLGLGMAALARIAWGRYLRKDKPRI